jgi:hypothetical protein
LKEKEKEKEVVIERGEVRREGEEGRDVSS